MNLSIKATSVIDLTAEWLSIELKKEPVSICYEYGTGVGRKFTIWLMTSERIGTAASYTDLQDWIAAEIRRQRILFRRY